MLKHDHEITILMADDDEDDREFINDAFATTGSFCRLQFVENGRELLDYVHHRGKFSNTSFYLTPDLILLDINMPLQNGFEALETLRANGIMIPVIILSNSEDDDTIRKAYRSGANAYISKPQTFDNILKFIESLQSFWFTFADYPREP